MPMQRPNRHQHITPQGLSLVAARFKLLSEPLRLQILNCLDRGERSVSRLATEIGTSQQNTSKHLRLLIDGGLVARRREGTSVFVSIADASVFDLCHLVCSGVETHLHARARSLTRKPRERRRPMLPS